MADYDRIEEHLWIGCINTRNDVELLRKLDIEVVISILSPDEKQSHAPNSLPEEFIEYDIEMADTPQADIFCALSTLIVILEKEEGKNCLVHCYAGQSRSPALVIGYLMYRDQISFTEALFKVKSARSWTNPNRSFLKQLLGDWPQYLFDKQEDNK